MANGALHHFDDGGGVDFNDGFGICVSRGRTTTQEHDHELLAVDGGVWKPGGDGDYETFFRSRRRSRGFGERETIFDVRGSDVCGSDLV